MREVPYLSVGIRARDQCSLETRLKGVPPIRTENLPSEECTPEAYRARDEAVVQMNGDQFALMDSDEYHVLEQNECRMDGYIVEKNVVFGAPIVLNSLSGLILGIGRESLEEHGDTRFAVGALLKMIKTADGSDQLIDGTEYFIETIPEPDSYESGLPIVDFISPRAAKNIGTFLTQINQYS